MFATVYISEGLSGVLQTTCQVTELARDASRWRSTVRQSGSWSEGTASLSPGRSLKAKFHYTDTDTDKVRARCRVRANIHNTDTDTDFFCGETDPHGPNGVSPQKKIRVRVRVVEFSYNEYGKTLPFYSA